MWLEWEREVLASPKKLQSLDITLCQKLIEKKNERKKLDKIDRSRKFEPKTLNEPNDDVSDSNMEVALPKPFLTNLTHKKMMTNSNKSSCTNPQFQELDDMDSADNVVLREKSSVKVLCACSIANRWHVFQARP